MKKYEGNSLKLVTTKDKDEIVTQCLFTYGTWESAGS